MHADYPMRQLDIGELAEVTYLPLDRKLNSKDRSYHNTFIGSISETISFHILSMGMWRCSTMRESDFTISTISERKRKEAIWVSVHC